MVEGIDWPALSAVQTMNLRALQYMLDRTQWWVRSTRQALAREKP